jgi:outer membrane biosynthesis protein TonB
MARPQKKKRAVEVSLIVSIAVHVFVVGALGFFAAREGYLGEQLKTITVTMAPKEELPEPEKLKEPEPLPEPPPEAVAPEEIAIAPPIDPPPVLPTADTPPPPASVNSAPPAAAPPPTGIPAFTFSDGAKAVDSTSDPVQIFKGFVEFSFRSKWARPEGIDDSKHVAEIEVSIQPDGRITGSTWKRASGDPAWDASIRRAISQTTHLGRTPPTGFPDKFIVRFDVAQEIDTTQRTLQ